jgi:hypothetical protein
MPTGAGYAWRVKAREFYAARKFVLAKAGSRFKNKSLAFGSP